jgi:biotin carboxyl carrier protein
LPSFASVRPPVPAPPVAPPVAPTASPAPGPRDLNVIAAPIAGTVQKLFVAAGTAVEAKTPVVLLDAMKMDTYIYAPRSGEVAEVCVAVGQTVQVGDVLLRYRPEA